MAARTPTAYTQYVDLSGLVARHKVLVTEPNHVVDDQDLAMDKQELVVSDFHGRIYVTGEIDEWVTARAFWVTFPDRASAAPGTIAGKFTIHANAYGTDIEARVFHVGSATGYQFTCQASPYEGWQGNSGGPGWTDVTLYDDGTENELLVQFMRTVPQVGNPGVYYCGIGMYA